MLTAELFKISIFEVCFLNILTIAIIILLSIALNRYLQKLLTRYLINSNIRVEGRSVIWLRIFSQLIYAISGVLAVWSFKINNPEATLEQFLAAKLIKTSKIDLSFESIIYVGVIIFSAKIVLNFIHLYLKQRFKRNQHMDKGSEYVYIQVAKYLVYIFAFFFILGALDVQASYFLGGSAALLVGLGLGIQDVFKDMFSGLVLLFEGSIRVGDVIELHDGKSKESIVAKILRISVRTTEIETRDGNVLIVPNAKLTQEYIENWSHGSTLSRFRIYVTVHYGTDTELVSNLLIQAANSHPKVKKEEPIQVRMTDFAENGLQMELIFWADQNWDINQYKSEIRFEIDRLFRQHNIVIPYPQREVYTYKIQ